MSRTQDCVVSWVPDETVAFGINRSPFVTEREPVRVRVFVVEVKSIDELAILLAPAVPVSFTPNVWRSMFEVPATESAPIDSK